MKLGKGVDMSKHELNYVKYQVITMCIFDSDHQISNFTLEFNIKCLQ